MLVALAALFIALGGTGYAVMSLPKQSVGTRELKQDAVTGPKIKEDSVEGSDLNESTLGTVPAAARADSAATADTATSATTALDANTLGGLDQSAFLRTSAIHRFGNITASHGQVGVVVATLGDVQFMIGCQATFAEWGVIGPPSGNTVMFSSNGSNGTPSGSGFFLTAQDNSLESGDFTVLTSTGTRIHGVLSAAEDPFGATGCRFGGFAIVDA
jgi:hypothetical protein